MSPWSSRLKAALGAVLALAFLSAGASADEPTPAALGYAKQIFVDIGMKPTLDQVVPALLGQLEHNVTATRPELKDGLHAALLAIQPEFVKTEDGVLDAAVKVLAGKMTEQELKDTAAFYESASGKKFVATQPAVLEQVGSLVRTWRERLSTDILTRAHEEMKKKGHDF